MLFTIANVHIFFKIITDIFNRIFIFIFFNTDNSYVKIINFLIFKFKCFKFFL